MLLKMVTAGFLPTEEWKETHQEKKKKTMH